MKQMSSVIFMIFSIVHLSKAVIGPRGMERDNSTTCEEFSKHARFNPYSVLGEPWMVFFYWGPHTSHIIYTFTLPNEKQLAYLQGLLDPIVKEPVNWTSTKFLMTDQMKETLFMVERGDRGQYSMYPLFGDLTAGDELEAEDIRFKQTGDNKYLGFMLCKSKTAFALSRFSKVPLKKNLQDAAARIGFRGRGGKSYLYQGRDWVPMPDASEWDFWGHPGHKRRFFYE